MFSVSYFLILFSQKMASGSLETASVLCSQCQKSKGTYKCQGCEKVFCFKHVTDHRNELGKEFDDITGLYDQFQQTLAQQNEDLRRHPLFQQIDQWEQQSISEIRSQAQKKRDVLHRDLQKRMAQIQERFKVISSQLRQAREENDFLENDLRLWRTNLKELSAKNSRPVGDQYSSDVFDHVCGNAKIEENGQLIVKNNPGGHTEIRGKNEYASEQHYLRFRVEKLLPAQWISFGVLTKSAALVLSSYSSPSSYSWSNQQQTYIGGVCTSSHKFDITEGDLIVLSLNCAERKIVLKNERTQATQQLSVDLNKCPFPWQFHLNLYHAETRVRILHDDE